MEKIYTVAKTRPGADCGSDNRFLIAKFQLKLKKVGNQEIPGVRCKFGLGVQNEAGQRLTAFCQENALIMANTIFQQHKRQTLYIDITKWSILKSH